MTVDAHVCPYCSKRVDPNASGVTYAVEIRSLDGTGAFFHPGCPPSVVGYRTVQLPGADLTTP